MKVRKWITIAISVLLCLVGLTGCNKKKDMSASPYKIYYLNPEQTGLVEEAYTGETDDPEKATEEILACLKKGSEGIQEQSVIPDGVDIEDIILEDEKLTLYFNAAYNDMDMVQEVLCRAALVRSLTQINGIDLVGFYVDGEPLTNDKGREYGYFQSDDFVQNTGQSIHSFEETNLVLYFANGDGNKLTAQTVSVKYNSNVAFEKVIVEQLMRGPSGSDLKETIPKGTKLLSVSIKDGICYLNFDEGLRKIVSGVTPEVVIYSIVNSVIESGAVNKVQISINGDSNIMYQESISLSEPLSRNLDLLEE